MTQLLHNIVAPPNVDQMQKPQIHIAVTSRSVHGSRRPLLLSAPRCICRKSRQAARLLISQPASSLAGCPPSLSGCPSLSISNPPASSHPRLDAHQRFQRVANERDVASLSLLLRKSPLRSGLANAILTTHIQLTLTWKELYRLLLEFSDLYNHINVTATITHLCKLTQATAVSHNDQHEFDIMLMELREVAEHLLGWYRPREVANITYGMAKLRCYDKRLIQLLVGRAQIAGLSSFNEQEVINFMWALAKLGHPVPQELLTSFLDEVEGRLGRFKPQEMANAMYTLAVMRVHPGREWMEKVLEQCGVQLCLFKAQEFASLAWSLATMQYTPKVSWLRLFISRSYPILPRCNEQNLANLAWALARLKARPFPEWVEELDRQVALRQHVLTAQPQHVSMLLAGMARLPHIPRSSTLRALTTCMLPRLKLFKPMDLSECLWALAHLHHKPAQPFLQAWAFHMQSKMESAKSQDLSMLLWALAKMDACPSVEWMRECSFHVIRTLSYAQLQHIANVLWAYTKMQVLPTRRWLSLMLDAFISRCSCETPRSQELANVVWALPQLVLTPKHGYFVESCSEVLYQLEEQCYGCMGEAEPRELVQMVLGFSRLDYLPGPGWLAKHQATCLSQLEHIDEREYRALRQAYRRFDSMAQRSTSFIFSVPDGQHCSMVQDKGASQNSQERAGATTQGTAGGRRGVVADASRGDAKKYGEDIEAIRADGGHCEVRYWRRGVMQMSTVERKAGGVAVGTTESSVQARVKSGDEMLGHVSKRVHQWVDDAGQIGTSVQLGVDKVEKLSMHVQLGGPNDFSLTGLQSRSSGDWWI